MIEHHNTIIVGAGISGIACAKRLLQRDIDFLIISPDIGGRILQSEDNIQYGAYYMMKDYNNSKDLLEQGRRINPLKIRFHSTDSSYKLLNKKLFIYIGQFLRLILLLIKFKRNYKKFKKECLYKPQPEALKENFYLFDLYNTPALKYIDENNLHKIAESYVTGVIQGSTFTSVEKINAFTLLHLSLPLITPIYEFTFKRDQIEELLSPKYIKEKLIAIEQKDKGYIVTTDTRRNFSCKNIVLAVPPQESKMLLKSKEELKETSCAHMYHIEGNLIEEWDEEQLNLFDYESEILAIAKQRDNSYLFYTKKEFPNFQDYFSKFEIISHKHWNPAFNIEGSELLDFKPEENIFLIGDHNICCLEDCYIYGKYTGNVIKSE